MKQPLALWLTDLHLVPETIDTVFSVISQSVSICLGSNIPAIILGGDIFTSRVGQPQSVLTAFTQILDFINENGIKVIAIAGNHDKTDYTSIESFLDPFTRGEGFTLYKSYGLIELKEHGLRFHFIPFFDEKLTYAPYLKMALENVTLDVKNILFTHIAISGVKNNDGSQVQNDFTANDFKSFHKVLVGHYHNRQVIGNVVYTGSAYQGNFGEDDNKGCTIVYSDGSIEFIKLQFPTYNTFKINDQQFSTVTLESLEGKTKLKLQFKPNVQQLKVIQQLESKGVKVEYEYEVTTQLGDSSDIKTEFNNADIIEYFHTWCDEEQITDKQFGLKQLQK